MSEITTTELLTIVIHPLITAYLLICVWQLQAEIKRRNQ
jgi:hypothetical protein